MSDDKNNTDEQKPEVQEGFVAQDEPQVEAVPIKEENIQPEPVGSVQEAALTPAPDPKTRNFLVTMMIIFSFAALAGIGLWLYRNVLSEDNVISDPEMEEVIEVPTTPESSESTTPVSELETDLSEIESDLDALEEDLDLQLDGIVIPNF